MIHYTSLHEKCGVIRGFHACLFTMPSSIGANLPQGVEHTLALPEKFKQLCGRNIERFGDGQQCANGKRCPHIGCFKITDMCSAQACTLGKLELSQPAQLPAVCDIESDLAQLFRMVGYHIVSSFHEKL